MKHRKLSLSLLALPVLVFAAGCGSTSGVDIVDPAVACADFTPLATAEEVASSGRANAEAEILALRAGASLVADQALYELVEQDLATLRAEDPFLETITARGPLVDWIGVTLTPPAFETYLAGEYDGWDCANDHYGATDLADIGAETVSINFTGKRYRTSLLLEQYETFAGVAGTGSGFTGDSSDICMDVQGDTRRYLFIEKSGDCPSGCTDFEFLAYDIGADGQATPAGNHCNKFEGECHVGNPSDTLPQWVSDRSEACNRF